MKTIQAICQIFNVQQIPYHYYQQTQQVGLVINLKNSSQVPFMIQERDQGTWLDISVPKLIQVQDSVFKGVIFQTLLTHSYETAMVRYFYNPNDGYISASLDLPLLEMNLSERSLMYCLTLLVDSLNDIMPRLRCVISTGRDPGRKSSLEQLVEQMSPESLDQIAQLIALRQQGGGNV
jgi:hypothetical protein